MARLKHANGVTVEVAEGKVEGLLARGFTAEDKPKAPARKAASKSDK